MAGADGTVKIAIELDGSDAESGFKRLKGLLSGAGDSAKSTGSTFKQMLGANVIGNALTSGIRAIGSGVRSMVGELNDSKKAWDTFEGNMKMLGNSDAEIGKAKKAMQDYATQTIYSASDMASTYSQLAAVGVDNVDQLVTGFGGLAASAENPAQAMKSLSMQATQMAAKPKVAWQDFKIMMEQAPAGMSAVAKEMGMSMDEMIAKIQDGELSTNDFFDAITKVGNNEHFSKMATEFKTVDQAIDGLKESLSNKLMPMFNKLTEIGIAAVNQLADFLEGLDFTVLEKGFDTVVQKVQEFFEALSDTGVLQNLQQAMSDVWNAIKHIFSSLTGDTQTTIASLGSALGEFINHIANVISSVAQFISSLDPGIIKAFAKALVAVVVGLKAFKVVSKVTRMFRILGSIGGSAFGKLSSSASSSGGVIKNIFSGLGDIIKKIGSTIGTVMKSIGSTISGVLKGLSQGIATVAKGIGSGIATAFRGIGQAIAMVPPTTWLSLSVAILAVGAALTLMGMQGEGIQKILEGLGSVIESLGTGIATILTSALEGFAVVVESLGTSIATVAEGIGQAIATIITASTPLVEVVGGVFTTLAQIIGDTIVRIVEALAPFIPEITKMVEVVVSNLPAIITAFGDLVSEVGSAISEIVSALADGVSDIVSSFATFVGEVGSAVSQVVTAFSGLVTAIGTAISEIATAVTEGIATIVDSFSGLVDSISGFVDSISGVIETLGDSISKVIDSFANLGDSIKGIIDEVGNTAEEIAESFQIMTDALTDLNGVDLLGIGAGLAAIGASLTGINLTGNIGGTADGMSKLSESLNGLTDISTLGDDFTGLKDGLTGLGDVASTAATGITEVKTAREGIFGISALGKDFTGLKTAFTGLGSVAVSSGVGLKVIQLAITHLPTVLNSAKTSLTNFSTALKTLQITVTSSLNSIKATFTTAMNSVKTLVTTTFNSINTAVTSVLNRMKSATTSSLNAMKTTMSSTLNSMRSSVSSSFSQMVSTVQNSMNRILSILRSTGSSGVGVMRSAGYQIGNGLAQGMYSALGAVTAAANALVNQALRAARAKAMIHSPSRLFSREVGRYLPQGVAVGIDKNVGYATSSMQGMVDELLGVDMDTSKLFGLGKTSKLYGIVGGGVSGTSQTSNTYNQNYTLNANSSGGQELTPEFMTRIIKEMAYYTNLEGGRM